VECVETTLAYQLVLPTAASKPNMCSAVHCELLLQQKYLESCPRDEPRTALHRLTAAPAAAPAATSIRCRRLLRCLGASTAAVLAPSSTEGASGPSEAPLPSVTTDAAARRNTCAQASTTHQGNPVTSQTCQAGCAIKMMHTPKPSSLLGMWQLTRRQLLYCYARREPCGQHANAVTADLPVGCGVGCIFGVIHHTLDSTSEELEGRAEAPLLQIGHHKARTNGHHAPAQHNTTHTLFLTPFLPISCVLVVYIAMHSLCVLLVYSIAQHVATTQSQIQQR
jgi:hypothetical protein